MREQSTDLSHLLIGESRAIRELRLEIPQLARGRQSVLIQGATGTGKELVARALHAASGRLGRFVAVNVSAIAETLFESELFGHVKGAFSGATSDRAGLVRSADRGTLFLDEIGELPLGLQAKLLRVLEQREIWPVGTDVGQSVDLRAIVATNANLVSLVDRKLFRQDLLYRLRGRVLTLPPLAERLEDIPLLVEYFLQLIAAEYEEPVLKMTQEALDVLRAHVWPGNIRELRQVLEHAVIRAEGPMLQAMHITRALHYDERDRSSTTSSNRHRLLDALKRYAGDASAAAQSLGMSRATLYRHMRKYGISLRKMGEISASEPSTSL